MHRRSFLSLTAASVAASALGQSPAGSPSASSQPIPPVLANQDRTGELHTMSYSAMAFKVLTSDSQGDLFMIEHHNHQAGGPPRHLHPHQDETFYVLEGSYIFEVGERRVTLQAGDSVLAPRNIPHVWACAGTGTGKLIIMFTPAGKMEAFFDRVSANHASLQDAALFRDYDMELLGPPLSV